MSTHLNANANVSFDSNANANANAIFQGRIQMQMQMFWGRIKKNANVMVTHLQMHLQMCNQNICIFFNATPKQCKCICKRFGSILTICFIWRKNNVMYTNTLLIYLINAVVHLL